MSDDKEIVIYDRGKEVKKRIPPGVLQLVLLDDMAISLREIEKSHKKEEFEGRLDPRTLSATDERQWIDLIKEAPHTPWVTAYFYNQDATNSVKIAVNNPLKEYTIEANEDLTLDYTKGDRRIERIFYRCDTEETASIKALGKY